MSYDPWLTLNARDILAAYDYLRRVKMSMGGKARHFESVGLVKSPVVLNLLHTRIAEMLMLYQPVLKEEFKNCGIMVACRNVKQMNGITVALLYSNIDLSKAPTPAALWRYCGLGVAQGMSDTLARIKGFRLSWSPVARDSVYALRSYILRRTCPYRVVYDLKREEYGTMGHNGKWAHRRALRYVTKLWLRHLWVVGRTILGLSVGEAHRDDKWADPRMFGWSF